MPIYEYVCHSCGATLEVRQKFSDAPLRTCPTCDEDALERLISESSFALKGSGWYADGYGPGGAKKTDSESTANSSTKSDSTKADSTKADSDKATKAAPAAKTEAKAPKPAPKSD